MTWDNFPLDESSSDSLSTDVTPAPKDVEFMALALEGRHGTHAAEIAAFFSDYHCGRGDAGRSWAWAGVADIVRKRQLDRATLDI